MSAAKISSRSEVMRPLLTSQVSLVRQQAVQAAADTARQRAFDGRLPEHEPPLTLAKSVNTALTDLMALHNDILLFGEDVAQKGGVYGVTRGLLKRFGSDRVSDTLLDE